MPLEVLRWPVTPVGMHYLLIHYDVPLVGDDWALTVDGNVGTPFTLSLDELRALPAHEVVATMECAGNGRAKYTPRPLSQPWLDEAIGTGRWRGARLRDVLDRAAPGDGAVEVLFTGLDRGVEGGEEQAFQRSLPLELARDEDVILAYELNGAPLPPQHGSPLRLLVPGWYGMTNVKWLTRITLVDEPFRGLPAGTRLPLPRRRGRPRRAAAADPPACVDGAAGHPGVHDARAHGRRGPRDDRGTRVVGPGADRGGRLLRRRRRLLDARRSSTRTSSAAGRGAAGRATWDATPGEHVLACRARDAAGNEQPLEPTWNVGGYANNAVQRVPVSVR